MSQAHPPLRTRSQQHTIPKGTGCVFKDDEGFVQETMFLIVIYCCYLCFNIFQTPDRCVSHQVKLDRHSNIHLNRYKL